MSEVERQDDTKAKFSLRVWRPIAARALANRNAVAGLLFGGIMVAGIETALPVMVGRIIDEARRRADANLLDTAIQKWKRLQTISSPGSKDYSDAQTQIQKLERMKSER